MGAGRGISIPIIENKSLIYPQDRPPIKRDLISHTWSVRQNEGTSIPALSHLENKLKATLIKDLKDLTEYI